MKFSQIATKTPPPPKKPWWKWFYEKQTEECVLQRISYVMDDSHRAQVVQYYCKTHRDFAAWVYDRRLATSYPRILARFQAWLLTHLNKTDRYYAVYKNVVEVEHQAGTGFDGVISNELANKISTQYRKSKK